MTDDAISPAEEATVTVKPAPAGYSSVTPWLISRNTARLIGYVKEAFGANELARIVGPDGSIGHAEVRIGDSVVMMFDGVSPIRSSPRRWTTSPAPASSPASVLAGHPRAT